MQRISVWTVKLPGLTHFLFSFWGLSIATCHCILYILITFCHLMYYKHHFHTFANVVPSAWNSLPSLLSLLRRLFFSPKTDKICLNPLPHSTLLSKIITWACAVSAVCIKFFSNIYHSKSSYSFLSLSSQLERAFLGQGMYQIHFSYSHAQHRPSP